MQRGAITGARTSSTGALAPVGHCLEPPLHCPQPPCCGEEAYQSQLPHSIQRLEVLRADFFHPQSLATVELFDNIGDFSLGDE
ncbi:hypothetical protein CHARACLAT_012814 [Characodon lateralis]|uniref:Uncharacterized protein n=1 Tax=Characodon lateralis TaxID=208331 RepID=A0ABU7CX21_9TELE|nr:hypothetical protein [Characodon lateralis]